MKTAEGDVRGAIENLIYAYAEGLDRGDFDGVGALFADADYGPAGGEAVRGRQAVADLLRASVQLYAGVPATKHVTTNVRVELDGRQAVARSYFTVFQAVDGRAPEVIVQGRYHDRFVADGAIWRFARRTIYMDALGDVSRHLKFDVADFVGR